MNQQDLERIAALLDGRLEADEQDELLTEIGDNEALYEVFTNAARLRAADAEDVDLGAIGDDPETAQPRAFWDRARMPIAALAAAAVLVLSVGLALRTRDTGTLLDGAFAAGRAGTLPDDYTVRGWTVTRGATAERDAEAAAFRIGVHAAGLMAALGARDQDKAIEELSAIRTRLEDLELARPAIVDANALLRSMNAGDFDEPATRHFIDRTVRAYADVAYVQLGSWVEGQRLQLLASVPVTSTDSLSIPDNLDPLLVAELREIELGLSGSASQTATASGSLVDRLTNFLRRF